MMQSRAEKAAYCALFCAMAMILSYIEAMIPFELIIPLPGFKPGLANIAVMAVFLIYGPAPAILVSITRISLSALLFGSFTSLCYSLCGGLLAFLSLVFWRYILSKLSGYIGLGVLSAAFHSIGQCVCASFFFGPGILTAYLPYMLIFSVITGSLTGGVLSLIIKSDIIKISDSGKTK